ncbi:glycine cleavage system protein GcvH [Rhodocaloribacter litoris]|uniref:glycine cleavage system protein GcvH n=1 Tax=Rhodocaloribacter litoris TaxID=2558931 RepID=UPI0014225B01|nr:glycine cleavage system protein GcvH [Rhodocaloribacter litoris]QXD16455.1 glycine cleavage system protein GcvH [Rhodocaloribacter litoris]
MDFPSDLRYSKDHEWLRVNADGKTARVGITDFAQQELGDIVYVELPAPGDTFEAGEEFGTVEAVKTVSELYMPVSGTVVAVNEALADAPEHVNEDPYGKGWMIEIELRDPSEADALMNADTYRDMVGG